MKTGEPDFPLIDVTAYYFREGGFWVIGAHSYVDPDDADSQPEPLGDYDDQAESEADAREKVIELAEFLFETNRAATVVAFLSGNEIKCLKKGP